MTIQDIFTEKIGVYKNCWDTIGQISNIRTVLASLKKLEAKTEYARALRKTSIDEYKKFKDTMPGATFSGTFSSRQLVNQLTKSHTIVLDIDHISEQGFTTDEVKDILMEIPSIYYCQCSLSNDGIWALAAINCDRNAAFNHYEKILKDKNIILDKLADSTRLRFLCYDKDFRLKLSNIELLVVSNKNKVVLPRKIFSNITPKNKDVEYWSNKAQTWDVTNYEDWLKKAYCLAMQLGEDGREIFKELARRSGNYKSDKDVDAHYTRTLKKLRK